jgi:hypothetical protein
MDLAALATRACGGSEPELESLSELEELLLENTGAGAGGAPPGSG